MSISARVCTWRLAVFVLVGLVWFSLAFLGGYLQGQADAAAGNRTTSSPVLRLAAAVGLPPPATQEATLSPDEQARFRVFWEAWSLVEREFYDRDALDPNKMTYGALRGMLQTLGDPHTAFSNPQEKQVQDSSLRGSFEGIGVQVEQRDGRPRVIAPLEGSPAERAGLRTDDVISRVDGRDIKDLPLQDVLLLIRGPRGTGVTLTIERPGEPAPLTITVERAEIKLQQVRGEMLEGGLGYVRITDFGASSGADTASTLKRLVDQQARGVVLDLRSNPGGYLSAAVDVASQFVGDGVVLYQQGPSGQRQEYRVKGGGYATSLPVAVLIDKGSASASEIVAAALRDNGRAVLVGETSYGKGSVQTVHTLSDNSGLRVTSAIWLTPAGQPIEKQGLTPDLAVGASPDQAGQRGPGTQDPQLEAAVRALQTRLAAAPAPAEATPAGG